MSTIYCSGPGPHAPADGNLGDVPDGTPLSPALCAPCGLLPSAPGIPEPVTDIGTLAVELENQRARLTAAEEALDRLIVASLDGSL